MSDTTITFDKPFGTIDDLIDLRKQLNLREYKISTLKKYLCQGRIPKDLYVKEGSGKNVEYRIRMQKAHEHMMSGKPLVLESIKSKN